MRGIWLISGLGLLLVLGIAVGGQLMTSEGKNAASTIQPAADTVFLNGFVYTVDASNPSAQAVAIRDGVIVYVGSDSGAEELIGNNTEVIDLEGLMLMPGFQDPHLHVIEAGINESLCLISQTGSANQYESELADCAFDQAGSDWVRGAGASVSDLLELAENPLDIIDRAIPDRPALFLDDLGHGAWANSLALQAVGYDTLSEQPQGGVVVQNADGSLTGVVLENAQQRLRTAAFMPSAENLELAYQGLLRALNTLAQNGITTVSDAGGYWTRGHHEVWQRAEQQNTLTVRASNALYVYPDRPFDQQMADLTALYSNNPESLVRFNQVKIYVDGILDIGTSALYEPYDFVLGLPGVADDGFLYFKTEQLNQYARELSARDFQIHFHVTGDRGAGLALDAIESAQQANPDSDLRHRLTHLFLVDQRDRARFQELNVIADFQLQAGAIDPFYVNEIGALIGDRANALLPIRSLINAGARTVLSSDWDADELSPFAKLQGALTRSVESLPNIETAIRMMTLDVAYLLHHENTTGSIEVGKAADLIVLNENLFEMPVSQLSRNFVLLTMLSGEIVYQDPFF